MSLGDRLEGLREAKSTVAQSTSPQGWEPGIKYEADGSRIVTLPPSPALADEASWAAAVRSLGADVPDGFRVRLVEAKYDPAAWHRDTEGEDAVTRPIWRYRFVVEVAPARLDVEELLASVKRLTQKTQPAGVGDATFVFMAGDLQLGKPDGDGSAGTVQRFYESLDRALTRYKSLRNRGQVGPVLLGWVGDCIEGTESQSSHLLARLDLTVTEQVRVYRRLMAEQVSAFAELAPVHVAVVPGNHDEAKRVGNQMATRYDDSWAIEGAAQVADVMAAKGYDIGWTFPGHDGLHLTVDASGTRIGLLHGHQTRGKMQSWLANKALDREPIGTCDIVVSGHFHTLRLEHLGPTTWMQTGALDGGSTWWTHKGGLSSPPAALTFIAGGSRWHGLEIV
jgi:predicted phosphodiesterase